HPRHPPPFPTRRSSDLPAHVERGVLALRARRSEVLLLHVIGAGELDPGREFTRGVLTDVETGATHPIVLTPAARARYRELLAERSEEHTSELQSRVDLV